MCAYVHIALKLLGAAAILIFQKGMFQNLKTLGDDNVDLHAEF